MYLRLTQTELFDAILEARIKLQRVLAGVNRLPQGAGLQKFLEAGGDKLTEAHTQCEECRGSHMIRYFFASQVKVHVVSSWMICWNFSNRCCLEIARLAMLWVELVTITTVMKRSLVTLMMKQNQLLLSQKQENIQNG